MAEYVIVPPRQQEVALVRQRVGGMFNGSWFDSAPDHYIGRYDPEAVRKTETTRQDPVGRAITELIVRPPIEAADEEAIQQHGNRAEIVTDIRDNGDGSSTMILEAPSFEPPMVTAFSALSMLNHVHDYRTQTGVYDPVRFADVQPTPTPIAA